MWNEWGLSKQSSNSLHKIIINNKIYIYSTNTHICVQKKLGEEKRERERESVCKALEV